MRGDPPVSVNWTKNGVKLASNNTLVIRHVTFEDEGIYECTAENQAGKAHASFLIDVTGTFLPEVYANLQNITQEFMVI